MPEEPTAEEQRQHELLHEPYRSWCKACIAGRGRADPHVLRPEAEKGLSVICIDYGYLWDRAAEEAEGEEEPIEPPSGIELSNPMICGRCSRDRWIFAHLLRCEGADDYNRESLAKDLSAGGYKHQILRIDGEPAILAHPLRASPQPDPTSTRNLCL